MLSETLHRFSCYHSQHTDGTEGYLRRMYFVLDQDVLQWVPESVQGAERTGNNKLSLRNTGCCPILLHLPHSVFIIILVVTYSGEWRRDIITLV